MQTILDFDIKRKKRFSLDDVEVNKNANIKLDITFIDNQEELSEAINWLNFAPKFVGLDIETRGLDPYQHDIIMFQFGDIHRQFVIDTRTVDITEVVKRIIHKDIILVGQNLKFEYKFIKHNYKKNLIDVKDTMLQELCLYNGLGLENSLKALAKRYLNYIADKTIRMRFLEIGDEQFSKDEIIYGAYDVVLPMLIHEQQQKKIDELKMQELVDLEHKYLKVLGDNEYRGLFLDKNAWEDLYRKNLPIYNDKISKLNTYVVFHGHTQFIDKQLDMFDNTTKCNINWNSPTQVVNYFRYLGICPKAVSKTTKKVNLYCRC